MGMIRDRVYSRWTSSSPGRTVVAVLRFKLDVAGTARSVELVSSDDPGLGKEAANALRASSPFPAMNDAVRCLAKERITGDLPAQVLNVVRLRFGVAPGSSSVALPFLLLCAAFGVALLVPALLPGSAHAQQKTCPPIELLYDANEELSEKRSDRNRDCQLDEVIRYESGQPVRAESDSDGDGTFDTWIDYEAGEAVRQERDSDSDGKPDQWIEFEGGLPSLQRADQNGDGTPDSTMFYRDGDPHREESDTRHDGKIDRWVRYEKGAVAQVDEDVDGDEKPDLRIHFGADGTKAKQEQDTSGNGHFNVVAFFEGGEVVRQEEDPDQVGASHDRFALRGGQTGASRGRHRCRRRL